MNSPPADETVTFVTIIDNDELAWRMMKAAGIDVPGVVSLSDNISGQTAMKYIGDDNPQRAWRWREMAKAAVAYVFECVNENAEIKKVH